VYCAGTNQLVDDRLSSGRAESFENFTIFSPKTAVRCSRSNGWRSFGAAGDSSGEPTRHALRRETPTRYIESLVFGVFALVLLWCLELGVWTFSSGA